MVRDVIGELVWEIARIQASKASSGQTSLSFGEPDLEASAIETKNFSRIVSEGSDPEDSRVVFIDGGNAEIFLSPSLCVHFVRIFHSIYSGGARISCSSDEFYVLASTKNVGGKILYSVKLMKSKAFTLTDAFFDEELEIDSLEASLREGKSKVNISRVPGMVRRLAELSTSLLLAGKLGPGDSIILDGSLCARSSDEKKLVGALKGFAERHSVLICGLSKTSNLLTYEGESVSALLNRASPGGSWCYDSAARSSSDLVDVCFVKLHPTSSYVFRLDAFEQHSSGEYFTSLLSSLARNSRDAVFIGYPYGLVEADNFARVSNREVDCLRMMFQVKAASIGCILDKDSAALDAHSVLDNK
ncbi:MAG: DNA double-strand break repair nuclease NurA [Candidatus Woesearchaeota archaeon]